MLFQTCMSSFILYTQKKTAKECW